MNDYRILQPPFTLKFRQMSKKHLREYNRWFHQIRPERIAELTRAVQNSPGYEEWQADFTSHSLDALGEWFAEHVTTRRRTQEEMDGIRGRSKFPIDISGDELTNQTFSLAVDIGMYLAGVFLQSYPALKWQQEFGGKRSINYGQPVLVGFGRVPFNPVHMIVTLAYGIAGRGLSNRSRGGRLRELYNIWSQQVTVC